MLTLCGIISVILQINAKLDTKTAGSPKQLCSGGSGENIATCM